MAGGDRRRLRGDSRLYDGFVSLSEAGELTARVVGALWFERGRGEEQIDGLLAVESIRGTGGFGRPR